MSYFALNRRTKNLLQNILLCFTSILFILAAIEITLRYIGYNPLGEIQDAGGAHVIIRPSLFKDRLYEAVPNTSGRAWGGMVSINSYGFRDREYSISKNGAYRIIVLGDSIAFGVKLPDVKQTFARQLETMFASGGKKVEVLNLALGGYDTVQEAAILEDIGMQFSPDVVVVAFCINDVVHAAPELNYITRLPKYNSWIYQSMLAQFIRTHLDEIEAIRALENDTQKPDAAYAADAAMLRADPGLRRLVENLKSAVGRVPNKHIAYGWEYTNLQRLAKVHYGFQHLKKLQAKGFRVIVYIVPVNEQHDEDEVYRNIYQIVAHEAGQFGFEVQSGYDSFNKAGFANLFDHYGHDIIHTNAQGHQLIAGQLYRYLQSTEPALSDKP